MRGRYRLAVQSTAILLVLAVVLVGAMAMKSPEARTKAQGYLAIGANRLNPLEGLSADSATAIVAATEAGGRRCTHVSGSTRVAASGTIEAGGWNIYRQSWAAGGGKLWWRASGAVPGSEASTMIVRAISLDAPLPASAEEMSRSNRIHLRPVSRRGDTLIYTMTEGKNATTFPSGVRLPTPGRWMLVATMGPNWGCFIYRL